MTIALCVLVIAALMAGCVGGGNPSKVLAVVNGEPVTMAAVDLLVNEQLAASGYTQDSVVEEMGEDVLNGYKAEVLEDLIAQYALMQYAEENGLTLSAEEEQQVQENTQAYMENLKTRATEGMSDGFSGNVFVNTAAEKNNKYNEYINRYGVTEELAEELQQRQLILPKVREKLLEGFQPAEEDARAYYEELLATQKQLAEEDPDTAVQNYTAGSNAVNVFVPESLEGARYVKHILIGLPEEAQTEISAAQQAGDTAQAEELQAEYMAEALKTAQEAQDKINAGADFEEMIAEYNEDPGMASQPDGYLVYEGANFVEDFLSEALTLEKVGDITTEPVESEFGYHIIQFAKDVPVGTIPYEDVKDEIWAAYHSEGAAEYWRNAVQELKDQATVEMGNDA